MKKEEIQADLQKIKHDEHYYGATGRKYLSASDINTILFEPYNFFKKREEKLDMLKGKYFHASILEPAKINNFKIIEANARSSIYYKEAILDSGNENSIFLLKKEAEELDFLAEILNNNTIYKKRVKNALCFFEQPKIDVIDGEYFKCKADIVLESERTIFDIKTITNEKRIRSNFFTYNLHCQAFIYTQLFGSKATPYEMEYIFIDKSNGNISFVGVSEETLLNGKLKVLEAIDFYRNHLKNSLVFNRDDYVKYDVI